MSDKKEYIKGDKHVHHAGSVLIKFQQFNIQGLQGQWTQKDKDNLEAEFAEFEEVVIDDESSKGAMADVKPELPPADVFVNRVKAIILEASKKNGLTINTNTRAWSGSYQFFVDGQRIACVLDDLRLNYEDKIMDVLDDYTKYDGVSLVSPFIGRLLKIEGLATRDLQKTDMMFAFAPFYKNCDSAIKRMSDKFDSQAANVLFGTIRGLLKRHPKG